MYGYQNFSICPDIITMAKPLANGLPLGAVLVGEHVASCLQPGDHGTTVGGSPLATRVGQYVWSTISQPEFLRHVIDMGAIIEKKANELVTLSPIVKQVRGKGLLMGMELRENVPTSMFVDLCREKGVLVVSASCNTIRLIPALIVTETDIEKAFKIFESVITTMESVLATGKTSE
jgi:acetylornithine aminotransferase